MFTVGKEIKAERGAKTQLREFGPCGIEYGMGARKGLGRAVLSSGLQCRTISLKCVGTGAGNTFRLREQLGNYPSHPHERFSRERSLEL